MSKKLAWATSALLGLSLLTGGVPAAADDHDYDAGPKLIGDCEYHPSSVYCDGPDIVFLKDNQTIVQAHFVNSPINMDLYKSMPNLVHLTVSGGANTDLRPLMQLEKIEHFGFVLNSGVNKVRMGKEFTVPSFTGFDGKTVQYKNYSSPSTRKLTSQTGVNKFKATAPGHDYFLEPSYHGTHTNGSHKFTWNYEIETAASVLVQDDILPTKASLKVWNVNRVIKPKDTTVPVGTELSLDAVVPSKIYNGATCVWYRNNVKITDVSRGYRLNDCYRVLTKKDSGKTLKAVATFHPWPGYESSVLKNTATYQKKLTVAEVLKPKAKITGTKKVGSKLTAAPSNTPKGTSYAYQWLRNGKNIKGATKKTYTLAAADLKQRVSVKVTAKKSGYISETVTTGQTGKIAKGALKNTKSPTVSGKKTVGKTLTAKPGSWSAKADKYTYRWYRSGAPISKATKAKYKVTKKDKGKTLYVKVTAHKKGFTSKTASSKVK